MEDQASTAYVSDVFDKVLGNVQKELHSSFDKQGAEQKRASQPASAEEEKSKLDGVVKKKHFQKKKMSLDTVDQAKLIKIQQRYSMQIEKDMQIVQEINASLERDSDNSVNLQNCGNQNQGSLFQQEMKTVESQRNIQAAILPTSNSEIKADDGKRISRDTESSWEKKLVQSEYNNITNEQAQQLTISYISQLYDRCAHEAERCNQNGSKPSDSADQSQANSNSLNASNQPCTRKQSGSGSSVPAEHSET